MRQLAKRRDELALGAAHDDQAHAVEVVHGDFRKILDVFFADVSQEMSHKNNDCLLGRKQRFKGNPGTLLVLEGQRSERVKVHRQEQQEKLDAPRLF